MKGHEFVNCVATNAIKCIHCGWEVPRVHLLGCGLTAADLSALICSPQDDDEDEFCEECDLIGDYFADCSSQGTGLEPTVFGGLAGWLPNPPQSATLAYLNDDWNAEFFPKEAVLVGAYYPVPYPLKVDCTCPTLLNGHHPECPREKK